MNKARYIFAAGAVFLSTALAAKFFAKPQEPTPKVLTWNCEIPAYKPESITLTCADGGWIVHTITWSKWGLGGAEGTGIFRGKLCEPSCSEGEVAEEEVKVKLSDLAERKGEFYLRTLDISTASGKDFISGRANGLGWDVMEFIEVMNWNQ
jgi:hypothetical protein